MVIPVAMMGIVAALAGAIHVSAPPPAYSPPGAPVDPAGLGAGIQRTMRKLATSSPHHRHRVRILFYGQSITEQEWWKQVADDLRGRFPYADLEIENRAIGGFASQLLIRPAEHDLYPFYPDLLIFHVYGANQEYEQIIKNVRSRTTAEVLMQRDHVTHWPQTTPDEKADKGLWWDYMMNNVFLRDIARKYSCGLADVRGDWLAYLRANSLEPAALLKDGVHLNDWGNFLMARLISHYLVYRPELPSPGYRDIQEIDLRRAKWSAGTLKVPFEGNRIDAIALPGAPGGPAAHVLIDGQPPSQIPGCYAITRPSPGPWTPLFLSRVDHEAPLVAEQWTLKVTTVAPDSTRWTYDVSGSVAGPDGSGESDEPFLSRSGRVKITPSDFFRGFGKEPVPAGYTITWSSYVIGTDTYTAPPAPDPSRESSTILAQGLSNGPHVLELVTDGARPPIAAVRVYRPPVR